MFNLSSEAVSKYWVQKGFFDNEDEAMRVATSVFGEAWHADPRAELLEFISKSIGEGRAEQSDLDRVSKSYQDGDWEAVMAVLGRINLIDGLNKSVVPGYGEAMLLADEAKNRQSITSEELLKFDFLIKERGKISVFAKSQSDEQNDFTANRLGAVEIEAQEIWDKIVTAIKG